MTLNKLREANAIRDKEWDPEGELNGLFEAVALGGECGEALNVVKKMERERMGLVGSRANLNDLGSELADIIICVDNLARYYGLNLNYWVPAKFNATSEKYGLKTRMEI